MAALSRLNDAQSEAGEFGVPDDVVFFLDFDRVDDALGEFWHEKSYLSGRSRVSTA